MLAVDLVGDPRVEPGSRAGGHVGVVELRFLRVDFWELTREPDPENFVFG